jgi:hypothetical protein
MLQSSRYVLLIVNFTIHSTQIKTEDLLQHQSLVALSRYGKLFLVDRCI